MKKLLCYFTKAELILWGASTALILASFLAFDRANYMTLTASMVGATSLIFNAKGNPIGQALMILFSLLYGIISYTFFRYNRFVSLWLSLLLSILVVATKQCCHPERSEA